MSSAGGLFSAGPPQAYRGERLGLPATGRGSLSTFGPRLGAYLIDAVASGLVAALFVQMILRPSSLESGLPQTWSLLPLAVDYVVGVLFAGRTLGMNLVGLRLIRVDQDAPVGPGRIVARTALLFLLIPAVIFDRDGRGLHDRATATAVVRS
jgi:uncharacterized RDD family membrane protein YckC